jgi:hypothetical protein
MPKLLMFFLSMLLLASPANALTLTVTSGVAGVSEGGSFEPGLNVAGQGFTLSGFSASSCCIFGLGIHPVAEMFFHATLTLNGVVFTSASSCCDNDSVLFLANDPFPGPTPLDIAHYIGPYFTTFTMFGHVPFGGPNGADLVGQGILTLGERQNPSPGIPLDIFATWTFNAPEPSPFALLCLSLGILAILALRGRLLTR